MIKAPSFWWRKFSFYSLVLYPMSLIYGVVVSWLMRHGRRWDVVVPVLCVGNFVMGGAGKTPTALALAIAAIDKNLKPGFLSRGYGRKFKFPICVDLSRHGAFDVGDEPLLLARQATTVVANNREIGAQMLIQEGVDIIIMDDGFHSANLKADLSLVVVDSRRGLGNRLVFPAGPLRVPLPTQLLYTDAILYIENSDNTDFPVFFTAKPAYFSRLKPRLEFDFSNIKVLVFSCIADTEKFFITVKNLGAALSQCHSFGDHMHLSDKKIEFLLNQAESENLVLVTTEKDAARLQKRPGIAEKLLSKCLIIRADMVFQNPEDPLHLIEMTLAFFSNKKKQHIFNTR
ncbi:tetraacyldisaccharide 4'-kinase [Candidatus Liberibacter sp.]|uniref:tetraacyldisaccharide 4'-kinase n=1 Tax=Candidatus Liberibacter sp. TaxID=34022 RepID=UPI0015F4135B|nr:tetraacyldisaccharide 4'-kinase [Candidatus Liberibacter sp.]MBA5724221.1 tetraacyldisaccharide 4'-kinase [Candidatus Liberibacter sp.]